MEREEDAGGSRPAEEVLREQKEELEATVEELRISEEELASQLEELEQSRDALRESEAKFKRLYDANILGMIFWDTAGNITQANREFLRIVGYTEEDVLSGKVRWRDLTPPEYAPRDENALREMAETGVSAPFEKEYIRKDGSRVPVVIGAALFTGQRDVGICFVRDLTERKRAEENEAEAKAYLESSLASSVAGVLLLDKQARFSYVNPAFVNWLGRKGEDFIGKTVPEVSPPFLSPETTKVIAERARKRVQTGEAITGADVELVAKDGRIIPVIYSASGIRDRKGKVIGEVVTLVDISERKRAEEELARSEQFLANVIEQNPSSTWISDGKGTLVKMNRACRELFGVTEAEVVGKYSILADNLVEAQGHMPMVRDVFEKGMIARFTLDYDARDVKHIAVKVGKRRILDVVVSPIRDALGVVTNAIVQHRDVTDLRRAEEERDAAFQQLRAANQQLEASNRQLRATERQLRQGTEFLNATGRMAKVGGWEVDAKTLEVKWTEQTYRLHEVPLDCKPPLEEAINFFHPEEQPKLKDAIQRALEHGEPYDMEIRFITAKGNHLWTRTCCEPEIVDGKTVRLKGVFQDISERKRAEEELRVLNAELEQRVSARTIELQASTKELEAFSYSVSHDLHAPLRAIDGFSAALAEDYGKALEPEAKGYVERIRNGVKRMAELIEALLTLSRVSRAEMSRERMDLSTLAQAIAEKLRQSQPERAAEWKIQKGLMAEGDPRLLRLVLENLLGNAWKFTGKTERTAIEFGARAQPEGKTAFFVKDNGAGFNMAYQDKLFVAFQRLHTVEEFPGTGIGLATVQRIVHRHGGRVWAEGEVGRGATFYFTLNS